ncbi:MAG: oxidoreductase [Chloroflexota bacterium]|nr:oxidoreductase [Chloroflexota bacterium]
MTLILPLAIPWLTAILLTPLSGKQRWVTRFGMLGLVASLVSSIWLAMNVFESGTLDMVVGGWEQGIGIRLRADALGIIYILLANSLLLFALGYEERAQVQEHGFPALVLYLAAGLNGLFLTGDVFNFYVFFEISMTASFVLVSYGNGPREVRDALSFTVVNLLGSVFFLAGVAGLYHVTGSLDMEIIALRIETVEPASVIVIAILIFVALSVKLGLFPFHFWLPAVYRGIRPVSAAILSGVLANIGSYGLIRFGADVLPAELRFGAPVLLVLGMASVFYGALLAISRTNEREVLAYSSVSQAGYILIALSIGGAVGLTAAILYSLVNALNKTLLFLTSGLQGRGAGAAFVIGAFSVTGLPPAVGFFGKAALFRSGIAADSLAFISLVLLGSALSFIYMFRTFQRSFWAGPAEEQQSGLSPRLFVVLALAGGVLLLGLWPEGLLAAASIAAAGLTGEAP